MLKANGLKATFEINKNTVQLVAYTHYDLDNAVDRLKRLLISKQVSVADETILNMSEWHQLVSQYHDANAVPFKKITISTSGQYVVVSGLKDEVEKVYRELNKFLTQNARAKVNAPFRSNAIMQYNQKSSTLGFRQCK